MKPSIYLIGIILILVIFGFILVKGNSSGDLISKTNNGEIQNVVLSLKDYNYFPNTVTVKAGNTVRISLDSSVVGCLRDFTIRDFKIRKYLKTPNDYVEFTPTKKGKYTFACSMGMGTGVLIVE